MTLFFDQNGHLRSGWRASIFVISYTITAGFVAILIRALFAAMDIPTGLGSPAFMVVNTLAPLITALGFGWLFGRLFEQLPFTALGASFKGPVLKHFLMGLVVGIVTFLAALAVPVLFGYLSFETNTADSGQIARTAIGSLIVFGIAAAFEEAAFRGYLLQTFARSDLAWLAIVLTSVLFGAVHLENDGSGFISTLNTMIAGVWFAVAYLKTRDLWFPWAIHWAWNCVQGSIFGIEVSGLTEITAASMLKEIDHGPEWLTGGQYGIEGGVACTAALLIGIAAVWFMPWLKADPEIAQYTQPRLSSPFRREV